MTTLPTRLVMMGTGTFAEPTFRALIDGGRQVVGLVTQPDRAVGDKRGSTRQVGDGMKNIALAHGIPVFQPESINTPEGIAGLKAMQPDLLVVAAYGQILSREVLEVAPLGGINVHASLLPKYRGAAPIAWAIYHGESETGVTIIRMTTALDAGEMVAQETIAIQPDETAGELEARLAPLGGRLALQVLGQLAAGTLKGVTQDKALATKAPKLTKEMGLIDWTQPAEQIANHIRAMQPWPTPYTFLYCSGKAPLRLIILRANEFPVRYDPGVLAGKPFVDPAFPRSLFVTAGLVSPEERSVLEVTEVQPAGKKAMSAADFLRGRLLREVDRLGGDVS